jgi:hypothetical protein
VPIFPGLPLSYKEKRGTEETPLNMMWRVLSYFCRIFYLVVLLRCLASCFCVLWHGRKRHRDHKDAFPIYRELCRNVPNRQAQAGETTTNNNSTIQGPSSLKQVSTRLRTAAVCLAPLHLIASYQRSLIAETNARNANTHIIVGQSHHGKWKPRASNST